MKKAIFIIPYFGKLPVIFPYWLSSCGNNPEFDWLIVTDIDIQCALPANVTILNKSFSELKRLIQEKLAISPPGTPYKLCDFKPAYGLIFEKECSNYLYWGWCDMDLIWGRLADFIPDLSEACEYEKIFEYGHCTLMKNNIQNRFLFQRHVNGIVDWKECYGIPQCIGFDEDCFLSNAQGKGCMSLARLSGLKIYAPTEKVFADLRPGCYSFKMWDNFSKYKKRGVFEYFDGRLFFHYYDVRTKSICKQEYAYVHLQKRKIVFAIGETKENHLLILPRAMVRDFSFEIMKNALSLFSGMKQFFYDVFYTISARFNQLVKGKNS